MESALNHVNRQHEKVLPILLVVWFLRLDDLVVDLELSLILDSVKVEELVIVVNWFRLGVINEELGIDLVRYQTHSKLVELQLQLERFLSRTTA